MNLKKLNKLFLSFVCLSSLFSCSNSNTNNDSLTYFESKDPVNESKEYSKKLESSVKVGPLIEEVKVHYSSQMYKANNIVNCSGMSGDKSYKHLHTSDSPRDTMYLTQANQKENSIILELSTLTQVGRIYIWNYNNFAKIDCSVKDFKVSYSSDGHSFTKFEDKFTLSKNQGNTSSLPSKVNGLDYLDLKGITTKYIKLDFLSNYGGTNYGLSEIRLYEYKSEVKEGNSINVTLLKNKGKYLSKSTYNLINGSGMDSINSHISKSSNNPYFMHRSTLKELTFDLRGNYPLGKIAFWNYNDVNNLNVGVKDVEIYVSTNGKEYSLVNKAIINKAKGLENEEVSTLVDMNNISAQYVKLVFKSNYGGSDYGLSEVRFILGKGRVSEPNEELTGKFSSYQGWSGADGIFNVRLNGNQAIGEEGDLFFNFSDTYIGEVNPVTKRRSNYIFKNNTFAYYQDGEIDFITDKDHISPEKIESRSPNDAFNWLGDSLVIDDKYYATSLYIAKQGALGFEQRGEDLVRFNIADDKIDFESRTPIIDQNTNKLSYFSSDNKLQIIFGAAYFENTIQAGALNPDGYIYNYGYRDDKNASYSRGLVVSRFKEEDIEDFSKYQYLSSSGWVNDITQTIPLCERVSCEMSVTEINDINSPYYGKYLLTYQKDTIGAEICIAISDSPYGKFENNQVIYSTPEFLYIDGISQYNAKMHPTLSSKDKYVISYNLNESGFGGNDNNGDIYHPRFIDLYQI